MITNVRKKHALKNLKQRDSEYLAIQGTFCSIDCVKAKCDYDKSKDIIHDLFHLNAEMFNSTLVIEEIKFDKNNESIEKDGEE